MFFYLGRIESKAIHSLAKVLFIVGSTDVELGALFDVVHPHILGCAHHAHRATAKVKAEPTTAPKNQIAK